MPSAAPRVCQCGKVVPADARCACQRQRDKERKARHDQRRPSARARGYTSDWQKEAVAYLALHPVCQREGCSTPSAVVDHIKPHRGDRRLFWDRRNWQALCRPCHSGWKQAQERRAEHG